MSDLPKAEPRRYLVVSNEDEIAHAEAVLGSVYKVLPLERAKKNETLFNALVLCWPDPSIASTQRMRDFAITLVDDAAEVKLVDTAAPAMSFMTLEFIASAEPKWDVRILSDFLNGRSDGINRVQLLTAEMGYTSATNSGDSSPVTTSEAQPPVPRSAAQSSPAQADALEAFGQEMPPDIPIDAYTDEISRIQAEPHTVPPWVHSTEVSADDDWPDPTDFWSGVVQKEMPLSCLPPAIAPFVMDQSRVIGTDPCQIALNSLVTLAACIRVGIHVQMQGNAASAVLGRVWRESPILWGAVVGDASTGKGPAFDAATYHFRQKSNELRKKNDDDWKEYEIQSKVYEKRLQSYLSEAVKNDAAIRPEPPEKPPRERLWTDDATLETLGKLLTENPRGRLMLLKDELSGWCGSMDAYSNGKTDKDRPAYLSFYEGKERPIDRVGGGSYHVPSFGGNILGGIQPQIMAKMAQRFSGDGMLQRFMVVVSKPQTDGDEAGKYDLAAVKRFHDVIDRLLDMQARPYPITLDENAARFVAEKRRWLRDVMRAQLDPAINSLLGKWQGLHGRLAITYACIEAADNGNEFPYPTVSLDHVTRSWEWIEKVLWPHATHFYINVLGSGGTSETEKTFGEYVLARDLREVSTTKMSGSWTWYKQNIKTVAQRKELVATLLNTGWVQPMGGIDRTGQLPTKYRVNPKVWDGRFSAQEQIAKERRARAIKYAPAEFLAQQNRSREPGED